MKLMLAALVATSAIAIVASVFAIWPAVADAPWEDEATALPAPSESAAAFHKDDVRKIVQTEVRRQPFPDLARTVGCLSADYLPGNGKWVVRCEFRRENGILVTTLSYVFDDPAGRLVD